MDNSEFILSKLDAAIVSARSIDLGSFLTSGVLGLASVFLALAAVLPPSFLGYIRFLLFFATGTTILLLYWVIRHLSRNRRARLGILRKWHQEIFFAKAHVDSLEEGKVRKMIELIHSMEDTSMSRNPQYRQFDIEFMNILK